MCLYHQITYYYLEITSHYGAGEWLGIHEALGNQFFLEGFLNIFL